MPEGSKMGIRPLAILLGKRNWGEVQVLIVTFHFLNRLMKGDTQYHFLVALVYMHLIWVTGYGCFCFYANTYYQNCMIWLCNICACTFWQLHCVIIFHAS